MVFQAPQSARCSCTSNTTVLSRHMHSLYRRHFRKLSKVHLRPQWQIFRISWKNHIPNVEVLRRANNYVRHRCHSNGFSNFVGQDVYIIHINDSWFLKPVFNGELVKGKRFHCGQRLWYKDVVKWHLKATHITVNNWETLVQDRQQWKQAILKKIYHKNTNMITISAIAFLMLLPLSSSVPTAGEALKLKLDYSLTN